LLCKASFQYWLKIGGRELRSRSHIWPDVVTTASCICSNVFNVNAPGLFLHTFFTRTSSPNSRAPSASELPVSDVTDELPDEPVDSFLFLLFVRRLALLLTLLRTSGFGSRAVVAKRAAGLFVPTTLTLSFFFFFFRFFFASSELPDKVSS
jgi:hypothetical protein